MVTVVVIYCTGLNRENTQQELCFCVTSVELINNNRKEVWLLLQSLLDFRGVVVVVVCFTAC